MTMNIQFNYDKNSLNWENDAKFRSLFCKTTNKLLIDKCICYKRLYLHEIYEAYGVTCPIGLCSVVFTPINDGFDLDINYEPFDDFVTITIEASYKTE